MMPSELLPTRKMVVMLPPPDGGTGEMSPIELIAANEKSQQKIHRIAAQVSTTTHRLIAALHNSMSRRDDFFALGKSNILEAVYIEVNKMRRLTGRAFRQVKREAVVS
jgi:hypothetical protein